jgi:uncharacterized glyoxalase superfamily protein PhnB
MLLLAACVPNQLDEDIKRAIQGGEDFFEAIARYRQVHGHWPDSASELDNETARKFTHAHFRTLADGGLLIYYDPVKTSDGHYFPGFGMTLYAPTATRPSYLFRPVEDPSALIMKLPATQSSTPTTNSPIPR